MSPPISRQRNSGAHSASTGTHALRPRAPAAAGMTTLGRGRQPATQPAPNFVTPRFLARETRGRTAPQPAPTPCVPARLRQQDPASVRCLIPCC